MGEVSVSVIIPCRNERDYIGRCLDTLLAWKLPKGGIEILAVDGMSTDGTRDILAKYEAADDRIRVLDNPGRIVPTALNIGIARSRGEFIVRIDAHAEYPSDYLLRCLDLLHSAGAVNAGGRVVTIPNGEGPWARAVASVTSHPFGVGGSAFRTAETPGFVDTVPFGTFRRSLFDKLGGFDERLTRNQDNEFNSRIIHSGGRIAFDPGIRVIYKNQASLRGLVRQAYHTGMWNVYTLRLHPHTFALRRFIPAGFVAFLACTPFATLVRGWGQGAFLIVGLYVLACLIASGRGRRFGAPDMKTAATFACYHASYGLGEWVGLWNLITNRWLAQLGQPLAAKS